MSNRDDRIDELLNADFEDFDPNTTQTVNDFIIDTCKDIMLKCIDDCVDICCDCCGDIETTNSDETCIRLITGTNSNNWMGLPGLNWDEYPNLRVNSISRNRIQRDISQALQNQRINSRVQVMFEDNCYLIMIDFLDLDTRACFRTVDGSLIKFLDQF